jgi:4-amino-4-deoxy-L-arabinose transferase-like glycosyltransferase
MPLLAAAFTALIPGHISICSTVNNDALLEVCYSSALLALLLSLRYGMLRSRSCCLGMAIGAALLTKSTGLLLLPVGAAGLYFLWRGGCSPKRLLRHAALAALVILAVSGWWFTRNVHLYGQLLPVAAFNASFAGTVQAADVVAQTGGWTGYLLLMGQGIFQSFWAVYGTARDAATGYPRFLPPEFYLLTAAISAAGAGGLAKLHVRRKEYLTAAQAASVRLLFITVALVSGAFLLFILQYFQMQGRYLYPAMLPISVLLATGWRYIVSDRYFRAAAGGVVVLLLLLDCAFLAYITP